MTAHANITELPQKYLSQKVWLGFHFRCNNVSWEASFGS